jgi:hypothetical protein
LPVGTGGDWRNVKRFRANGRAVLVHDRHCEQGRIGREEVQSLVAAGVAGNRRHGGCEATKAVAVGPPQGGRRRRERGVVRGHADDHGWR